MAECTLLKRCIFYNDEMEEYPPGAEDMKKEYCMGESRDCARYMVFKALGGGTVPPNLFPDDFERAERIILGKDKDVSP